MTLSYSRLRLVGLREECECWEVVCELYCGCTALL